MDIDVKAYITKVAEEFWKTRAEDELRDQPAMTQFAVKESIMPMALLCLDAVKSVHQPQEILSSESAEFDEALNQFLGQGEK